MGAGPFDLRYFFALSYSLLLPYSLLCVLNLSKINPQILPHTTVPAGLEVREFQSIRK